MSGVDVAVLGSANLDLVLPVDGLPRPGETVLASAVARGPGGKGVNQAVAAARAGAVTAFVGAVGDDDPGRTLTAALRDAGIRVDTLRRLDEPTGLAVVVVDAAGENLIVVAPGANATVTDLTGADAALLASARVVLAQLEVPLSAVAAAAAATRGTATRFVLNAAPARTLPDGLLDDVDVLLVNQIEAATLAGAGPDADVAEVAAVLLSRVPQVVVTLGAAGALHCSRGDRSRAPDRVPALPATPVDTTAAGDTYAGVFAATLAEGRDLPAVLRRAGAAAALSVERHGAVTSIPTRAEVDARLGTITTSGPGAASAAAPP